MPNQAGIDEHNGENAEKLAAGYKSIDRVGFHNKLFSTLKTAAERGEHLKIMELGCGSGDDAFWMAELGHSVVGVEPSDLRHIAVRDHSHEDIEYRDGQLPTLNTLQPDEQFDLVTMSAMWQYIDPAERVDSLVKIAEHVKPNGSVYLTYPSPPSRPHQFEVDPETLAHDIAAANARLPQDRQLNIDASASEIVPDPRGRKSLDGRDLNFYFHTLSVGRTQALGHDNQPTHPDATCVHGGDDIVERGLSLGQQKRG